jgi:O-antigen/teichoic acid export membrane protein
VHDLKKRVLRGGLSKVCAQATVFTIRIGSVMVLARILSPGDFGIVGMVTALTGVLALLRDFGLSAATVQRVEVTHEQTSTLFWLNILLGVVLTVAVAAMAPFIAAFYREPRLFWVTIVVSTGFLFNAAGVQHSALLQRQVRFTALAAIDVISLVASSLLGIGMALLGFGYWALVAAAVSPPIATTLCLWLTAGWIPGRPRRRIGLHSLMRFGGAMTAMNVLIYIAYNSEKVLLGRYWGAAVLGIYGRAYYLISIPTDNLNTAVGDVAFSALSRLQHDPEGFRSYFLKGYSLVLTLTIPMSAGIALFAPDLISVLLGPKWQQAVPILRLLAPTILVLALVNPVGWLVFSLGRVDRTLKASFIFAPLVIAGYAVGLPYGPKGVALGYSSVMVLSAVPLIAWCVHGTVVTLRDIFSTAGRPLISAIVAAPVAYCVQRCCHSSPQLMRLLLESAVLGGVYAIMLLYVMGQKAFYFGLIRALLTRQPEASPSAQD